MASLNQASRLFVVLGARIPINAAKIQRQVALVVDQALVLGTPVDTGFARSNWLLSVGFPRVGNVPPYAPGSRLGISESANAQGALDQAVGALTTHLPGQDIYVVNNAPYIETLGKGHSPQASPGWIERAIQAGLEAVRKSTLLAP